MSIDERRLSGTLSDGAVVLIGARSSSVNDSEKIGLSRRSRENNRRSSVSFGISPQAPRFDDNVNIIPNAKPEPSSVYEEYSAGGCLRQTCLPCFGYGPKGGDNNGDDYSAKGRKSSKSSFGTMMGQDRRFRKRIILSVVCAIFTIGVGITLSILLYLYMEGVLVHEAEVENDAQCNLAMQNVIRQVESMNEICAGLAGYNLIIDEALRTTGEPDYAEVETFLLPVDLAAQGILTVTIPVMIPHAERATWEALYNANISDITSGEYYDQTRANPEADQDFKVRADDREAYWPITYSMTAGSNLVSGFQPLVGLDVLTMDGGSNYFAQALDHMLETGKFTFAGKPPAVPGKGAYNTMYPVYSNEFLPGTEGDMYSRPLSDTTFDSRARSLLGFVVNATFLAEEALMTSIIASNEANAELTAFDRQYDLTIQLYEDDSRQIVNLEEQAYSIPADKSMLKGGSALEKIEATVVHYPTPYMGWHLRCIPSTEVVDSTFLPALGAAITLAVFTLLAVYLFSHILYLRNAQRCVDRATRHLRKANAQQRRILLDKQDFMSFICHEIRNPLNVLKGTLDLAALDKTIPQDVLSTFDISIGSMLTLVNDMLTLQKATGQKIELEEEPIHLNHFFEGIAVVYASQCDLKGVHFKYDKTALPNKSVVLGDSTRIQEILQNLLSNAVKFTDAGGDVSMTISVHHQVPSVVGSVHVRSDGRIVRSEDMNEAEPAEQGALVIPSANVMVGLQEPETQDDSTLAHTNGPGVRSKLRKLFYRRANGKPPPGNSAVSDVATETPSCAKKVSAGNLRSEASGISHSAIEMPYSTSHRSELNHNDSCNTDDDELSQGSLNEKVWLKIEVEDSGIGIHVDNQDIIFLPYHQAKADINRTYGGTGLGLPIVAELCRLMNGTISLYSVEGQGSKFTIILELQKASSAVTDMVDSKLSIEAEHHPDDAKTAIEGKTAMSEPVQERKLNVLIVDDHMLNRKVMSSMILRLGHTVAGQAENGEEAIRLMDGMDLIRTVDCVFMDQSMPGMMGLDCCRHLRQLGANCPIILISANTGDEIEQAARDSGITDFMPKPITMAKMKEVLTKYAGSKPMPPSAVAVDMSNV
eukprot:Clim_evm11s236 gene=Clim_evmTU11s236